MPRLAPLLAAALGAIALAVPFQAVAAPSTFHVAAAERIATADFASFDESGCLGTLASVSLISGTGHIVIEGERIPLSPNEADVAIRIAQFRLCDGGFPTPVWAKQGQAVVDRSAFSWEGNGLSTASLDTTVSVCDLDLVTGECLPGTDHGVVIDIAWTGVGETTSFAGPATTDLGLPYYVQVSASPGNIRFAEASGSVFDGTTDYAAGLTGSGFLARQAVLFVSLNLGAPPDAAERP